MGAVREYIGSVICCAIMCGILLSLVGEKNGAKPLIGMVCGVVLCLTVVSPLRSFSMDHLKLKIPELSIQAKEAAAYGTSLYQDARKDIIKQTLEAYIQDIALDMGLTLKASVSLREDCVPDEIMLTGSVTDKQKEELAQMIHTELGIPKEHQIWIGS